MHQIIVQDRKGTRGEILIDFDPSSFKYEYEINNERSISFTAYKTNMNADVFNMLQNEAIVLWKGQKYVIKQTQIKSDNTMLTVEVTAKHIFMEFQNHYILKDLENEELNNDETEEENKPSYTLEQYLRFGFNGNKLGFTYEIIGNFDNRIVVDELGNKNGMEYLIEGAELFDYIYFADNKKIYIYRPNKFYKMAEEVIRYKYNTDEVSASVTTTELKTFIRGYGKKKTSKETKNYNPIKTPQMTFKGKFIQKGNWRTETIGAYYEREFDCKWGNETLAYNLKKGTAGGIWDIFLDGEFVDTFECFSRTATTERIVIAKNLSKGKHKFKAVFKGGIKSLNYKDKKPIGYVGTEKQNILNLTAVLSGDDLYHYKSEYKSPNYKVFGHAEAPTVFDDNVLDKQELTEKLKTELQDEPTVELSTNYLGYEQIKENNIIHFVHEPLGYNTDLKVVKITEPHPLVNEPVDVEFSNAKQDIISIQQNINRKIKQINQPNKTTSVSTSVGIGLDKDIVGSVVLSE
ncbi:prophage endopeptidase tail family protein [Staphylococcus sp. GDY8P199P]|uniref:prophage endopeptidase tail family protein n=1 Tax=Staphylococcus sp. GDY8P199P TaxID=2804175 RepID=UPI001AEBDD4D|nr:prophage endopeptidase tail family protein [Staphylococcus sp. GDY8P199P]